MFERYKSSLGYFWQWDSNQQLIVDDDTVFEVHFSNRSDTVALVCDIKEVDGIRVVDVPNILLQRDWPLHVYAFAQDHTKYEKTFEVKGRDKPADYVYTETDVKSFDELEKKVDNHIADNSNPHNVTAEQINTYTKEEIDEKTKVTDVKINNTSIVSNGVATIPLASNEQAGVIKPYSGSFNVGAEFLSINNPTESIIDKREADVAVTCSRLDYAVKAAMCDGKGAAWTSEEQAAARRRLNIESGGSSYYLPPYYSWYKYLTDEDKAFLSDYVAYYHQNHKPKPVNIYILDNDSVNFPHASLVIKVDFRDPSSEDSYYLDLFYYDFTNNANTIIEINVVFNLNYVFQSANGNFHQSASWHWINKDTDYSVNITNATNHIRIVGYCNYDTNNTVTYDISTSYGNNFYEELGTKYYVVGFDTNTNGVIPMYWYNTDGYNLELRDMQDSTLMESATFRLLGYYYWGV